MKNIYICFEENQEDLLQLTLNHFQEFSDKDSCLSIYKTTNASTILSTNTANDIALLSVSTADSIIKIHEPHWIKKILKKDILNLNTNDKKSLYKSLYKKDQDLISGILKQKRKLSIASEIQEYLNSSFFVNIDGMIKFRFKNYHAILKEYIESKVEDYIFHKEYTDFMDFICTIVDEFENPAPLVHVVFHKDSTFTLYNDELTEIQKQPIAYLTGCLIENLSQKIILHNANHFCNEEILNSLIAIFKHRISFCSGCKICSQQFSH